MSGGRFKGVALLRTGNKNPSTPKARLKVALAKAKAKAKADKGEGAPITLPKAPWEADRCL